MATKYEIVGIHEKLAPDGIVEFEAVTIKEAQHYVSGFIKEFGKGWEFAIRGVHNPRRHI